MDKIKILIVDDSVLYRSQIRAALKDLQWVEIVGAASNGRIAIEFMASKSVDLVILDMEMPEMNGLQTLAEINARKFNCKTLLFSSATKSGAEITMEALKLGASDFIPKPGAVDSQELTAIVDPGQKIKELLLPKIRGLFPKIDREEISVPIKPQSTAYPKIIWELLNPGIIVIGSSTGGPTVLEKIFSNLSGPLNCPIVIVQHMPPLFTAALAERLSKASGIPAKEAAHDMPLEKNCIYVAPGDFHLRLLKSNGSIKMTLDKKPQINSVRPAVDPLFSSAAEIFKDKCLGFVLTGMGSDGKDGALSIKQSGGAMVIQNEASCVVYGMPGAVMSVGAYDRICSPEEIIQLLKTKASESYAA